MKMQTSRMRAAVAGARNAICAGLGGGLEKKGATRKNVMMTRMTTPRPRVNASVCASTSSASGACCAPAVTPGGTASAVPSGDSPLALRISPIMP